MNCAYSLLTVKSVDDEKRTITGMASTPTVDRMADIVDPLGAQMKTPMPLLLYHDSNLPVGTVDFAKATKDGIPFVATLPNVVEPGIVQDRVNEAYHSIKYKLLAAVSIGFRPLKDGYEIMKNGGIRFSAYELLEISLVAVPANPEAVIQSFKSMDPGKIRVALAIKGRRILAGPSKASPIVRLSAKSMSSAQPETRRKMQDWCDVSGEAVDEILAERARMLK